MTLERRKSDIEEYEGPLLAMKPMRSCTGTGSDASAEYRCFTSSIAVHISWFSYEIRVIVRLNSLVHVFQMVHKVTHIPLKPTQKVTPEVTLSECGERG